MTKIWATENDVQRHPTLLDLTPPGRVFDLMSTYIPGYWMGREVTDPSSRPRPLMEFLDWTAWVTAHSTIWLGGGWLHDRQRRFLGTSRGGSRRATPHAVADPDPMDVTQGGAIEVATEVIQEAEE